jgi:hypothetical protein
MPRRTPARDGQRWCPAHHEWHDEGLFARSQRDTPNGPIWDYHRICTLAEQDQRVTAKHADEATHIVQGRAAEIRAQFNRASPDRKITTEFVMARDGLNYGSLIPIIRAYLMWPEECICPSCGSEYGPSAARLTFDHRLPPRSDTDLARLHARMIGPLDHECNVSKGKLDLAEWCDREWVKTEAKRRQNELATAPDNVVSLPPQQGELFSFK